MSSAPLATSAPKAGNSLLVLVAGLLALWIIRQLPDKNIVDILNWEILKDENPFD